MTQETEDVVAQLRAKATWPEFSAADRDDFAEAADLIRSLSDRIDVLKEHLGGALDLIDGLYRKHNVELDAGDVATAQSARAAFHQEGIDG